MSDVSREMRKRPCPRCGIAPQRSFDAYCKPCRTAYQRDNRRDQRHRWMRGDEGKPTMSRHTGRWDKVVAQEIERAEASFRTIDTLAAEHPRIVAPLVADAYAIMASFEASQPAQASQIGLIPLLDAVAHRLAQLPQLEREAMFGLIERRLRRRVSDIVVPPPYPNRPRSQP